ncbi:P-loop NTPase fold protein [Anabaena sp. WFMT]|uniref:P-loop NTPase fold protein n=1 Tax=Anabaena sp. WFMT TaxID=3449730 RepID=UPI003F277821
MSENTNTAKSGVSREKVESIINNFLENKKNYKVLALKGQWGVGKTYLLQNILSKHKEDKEEFHYYASVFGISSIEQLKARLLANYKDNPETNNQDSKITKVNDFNKFLAIAVEWLNRNYERIKGTPKIDVALAGLPSIPVVGSLISVAGDLGLNLLFNLKAKESIICIDDLERKSSNLNLDELLGFVEYLVQELECQIILIYNEDSLLEDEKSKKALQDYREKVIDIEVELNPTVKENLDFIFNNHPDKEVIESVFINTGTNNIRVLRKTKWVIDKLIPLMSGWEDSLRNQVIKNTIVISLTKLDSKFSKEFFLEINTIDKQIIDLIQTSLFNEQAFIQECNILNEREKKSHIIEKFSSLYEPYSSSFGASEQEIGEKIIQFLEKHYLDLPIDKFEQLANLASSVGIYDEYNDYKKIFFTNLINNESDLNLLNLLKHKISQFPDLLEKLESIIASLEESKDITVVLSTILKNSGWKNEDIQFLDNRTVDEYYKWLQKGHPDLVKMVRECLQISNISASQKLREAIVKLAKESKLNEMRAKFIYNIDIDDANLPNISN